MTDMSNPGISSLPGTPGGGAASPAMPAAESERAKMLREAKAVNRYLSYRNKGEGDAAQEAPVEKPKTRQASPQSLEKQLKTLERQMEKANLLKQLDLTQKKLDLEKQLQEAREAKPAVDEGLSHKERLEQDFIDNAKSYGERKGITYEAWRGLNVPADILRRAGIFRSKAS